MEGEFSTPPLPSKKGLIPESPSLNYLVATDTQLSGSAAVESDIKGVGTAHSHAGVSSPDRDRKKTSFENVPPNPQLTLNEGLSIGPRKPPMPKLRSLDRMPSFRHMYSTDVASRLLVYKSPNRSQITGIESLRKRDELSSVFRSLDGEFHKFQSRHRASRIGVVRSVLIPFLKNYANHPSTSHLRPEDLDRRVAILNRWWVGLLEMLNGKNGESMAGNDRATVMEAAIAIMVRPEWDLPDLSACVRMEKAPRAALKSRSTTSLSSMGSEFLADSVFHNTRNVYSQNLLTQMAFVVDNMSHKNVSASVVAFCGKAIAYAFFYCSGVAEVLVQLWGIPAKTLRRVLATKTNCLPEAKLQLASESITQRFPTILHSLIFTSSSSMMRKLRRQPHVPIAAAHIPWHGPWLARWVGKDTDLFFAFMKSYHGLTCRLLPDDPTDEEIICTPGYLLTQAHILTILDANLQQTGSPSISQLKGSSLMTFDDILGEADASANVLLPVIGANRPMAENRLIMLLRDSLSGSANVTEKSQKIFAQSFEDLLKATVRQTSIFDHNACYTLCDFMEEAILIMARFYGSSTRTTSGLDWGFWQDVFQKMLESQNSMTEIRLYSFLFSLWGTLTSNKTGKRKLCLEWLLCEEIFKTKFTHWCPMVRAYFMRLLCWRIARLDGNDHELDREILQTLSYRLQSIWESFLYLRKSAEAHGLTPPSSTPCSPAPGRYLLIVRDDLPTASSGMFLSYDSSMSQPSRTQATAYERYSLSKQFSHAVGLQSLKTPDELNHSAKFGKRRWASLRNLMPFTSLGGGRSGSVSSISDISSSEEVHQASTLHAQSQKGSSSSSGSGSGLARPKRAKAKDFGGMEQSLGSAGGRPYHSHSFRFSLEWIEKSNAISNLGKSCEPSLLQRPQLPVSTQALLVSFGPYPGQTVDDDISCEQLEGRPAAIPEVSKYAGMALAEWQTVVNDFQDFLERRRAEGVPTDSQVETPTLKVEPWRRVN